MFPYVALAGDETWQPGPYDGVELMLLHKHEDAAGTLFFASKGIRHGPHVAKTGFISLTIFDGPLTVA